MHFEVDGFRIELMDEEPFMGEEFDRLSNLFFDRVIGNTRFHDQYFSYLATIANQYFEHELWHKAELFWQRAVQPALQWESENEGQLIHKGTPFYFWGMAAILRGELDMGYPLMHQALQEDIRIHNDIRPNTPAFSFSTLDYENVEQAFRMWPRHQANFLNQFLQNYQRIYGSSLSLSSFRSRFLVNPSNLDIDFIFAYTIGRLVLFDRVPLYARQNVFTSQLMITIIFYLLLIIETSIKIHNPGGRYFRNQVIYLSNVANMGITEDQLSEINSGFNRNTSLHLVADILDGNFSFQDGNLLTGLNSDILLAYGLRNYGAHNIYSVPIIRERFTQISQSLFNVLFRVVEVLY